MWRRRGRWGMNPAKKHFQVEGVSLCKKEINSHSTINVSEVTCKNCIKKMLKDGTVTLEQIPTYLHPATPTPKTPKEPSDEFNIDDYKNDYLRRLGVFK